MAVGGDLEVVVEALDILCLNTFLLIMFFAP